MDDGKDDIQFRQELEMVEAVEYVQAVSSSLDGGALRFQTTHDVTILRAGVDQRGALQFARLHGGPGTQVDRCGLPMPAREERELAGPDLHTLARSPVARSGSHHWRWYAVHSSQIVTWLGSLS